MERVIDKINRREITRGINKSGGSDYIRLTEKGPASMERESDR